MQANLPLLSKTGYAFIGFLLLCFAFVVYDRPIGNIEVVKGVVTHSYVSMPKYNPVKQRCRIKLGNGFSFEEFCRLKAGEIVNVCVQERKLRGPAYYANGCLS